MGIDFVRFRPESVLRWPTRNRYKAGSLLGARSAGMKLILLIPCLEPSRRLADVLAACPRRMPGFSRVETLAVVFGTALDAASDPPGVRFDHTLRFIRPQPLGRTMARGLAEAVRLGAECVVVLPSVDTFRTQEVPRLVAPILEGQADVVVGCRSPNHQGWLGPVKSWGDRVHRRVLWAITGLDVPHPTSEFRAVSRSACQRLSLVGEDEYLIESLLQARAEGLAVASVSLRRLSQPAAGGRSLVAAPSSASSGLRSVLRTALLHRPMRFFTRLALALAGVGGVCGGLAYELNALGWCLAAAVAMVLAGLAMVAGALGTMLAAHRRVLERLIDDEPVAEWIEEADIDGPRLALHPASREAA